MIIFGTAGHIDHGKSAIVKRLTGTDPDRLPEEKARGMTIDLGFAFTSLPSGEEVAFVDVPGHERFVKNMIAGAGGIDAVMLVIAADDGWMPQSEEHFQITRLLDIKSGLVVINKTDLVEPDWLELLRQDIHQKVEGSFLEEAPVVEVSATTGAGFDKLLTTLTELSKEITSQKDIGKARLYIDRSFVRKGIGRVVAGTLRGGNFSIGQAVSVWPGNIKGKIRSLQSNAQEVHQASPGQRTAISLTGVDKEYLLRGGVITDRDDLSFFKEFPLLALSVELLADSPVSLNNRRQVLFITGTTEMTGEIRIFNRKTIAPGGKGIVFFKPEEPICSLVGDRFIIRLPTPMLTLGGGRILDHLNRFPRQREYPRFEYLKDRLSGGLDEVILSELKKNIICSVNNFLEYADFSMSDIEKLVDNLIKQKIIGRQKGYLFHSESLDQTREKFIAEIQAFLQKRPHVKGLSNDELVRVSGWTPLTTSALVDIMLASGDLIQLGDRYNIAGRGMSLKGEVKKAHDQIMDRLRKEPYAPPKLTELASGGKSYKEAIKYLIDSGVGYKCGSEFIFLNETWEEIIHFVRNRLKARNQMAVADLKERFGFTRKYAIPILEETDRTRLTKRDGDFRVKGDRFVIPNSDS